MLFSCHSNQQDIITCDFLFLFLISESWKLRNSFVMFLTSTTTFLKLFYIKGTLLTSKTFKHLEISHLKLVLAKLEEDIKELELKLSIMF